MAECPICGLGERCRNHWIATQQGGGEIEFQTGPMTASEDNLILVQNKFARPELPALLDKLGVRPAWLRVGERQSAYLAWPLELRAAVNRALFPNGIPGGDKPVPPTPTFTHVCLELELTDTRIDSEQCLPDELLYGISFNVHLQDVGRVQFEYLQVLWDERTPWSELVADAQTARQARQTLHLIFGGLLDELRAQFCGQAVDLLCEERPEGLVAGCRVDEVARREPELHLGDEIERLVNERRLQPMLRDAIVGFGMAARSR